MTNELTGVSRSVLTNSAGLYSVPLLQVGRYSVTIEAPGFKRSTRSGILLAVGQTIPVDVGLEVGETREEISVTGDAAQVNTESTMLATPITDRMMTELPLNGRNLTALASLAPGVAWVNAPTVVTNMRGGPGLSANGARNNANTYLLDGSIFVGLYAETGLNYPSPDTVQEFNLVTNSYSAEYGRNPGVVMTAVTRSGTNELHGSLWEFLRNDALNARNFFAATVPKLRQNQFGAAAGGPAIKNKLFWFGSWQGLRIRQSSLVENVLVPTAGERAGNFSNVSTPLRNPAGGTFTGNQIPTSSFDPVAVAALQRIPLPNTALGTLTATQPLTTSDDNVLAKGDYTPRPSDTITVRYYYDDTRVSQPFFNTNIPNWTNVKLTDKIYDANAAHTHVFSPTLFNHAFVSFNKLDSPRTTVNPFTLADLGANWPPEGDPMPPGFNVSGRFNANSFNSTEHEYSHIWQIADTISWIHGRHSLKFGEHLLIADYFNRSQFLAHGNFIFDGTFTGNALADFLLGKATQLQRASRVALDVRNYSNYAFVQDDVRVSRKLVLNLGLRHEVSTPYADKLDRMGTFRLGEQSQVIPNAPAGLVYPGDPGVPRGLYPTDWSHWEPRIGFAFDPTGSGRTVIRAAWGMFSAPPLVDLIGQTLANQPFVLRNTVFAPASLSDPYQGVPVPFPFQVSRQNASFTLPVTALMTDPDYHNPYVQQMNFTVQRQITTNLMAQASYVGVISRHLLWAHQYNPAVYIPGDSTAANVDQRRIIEPGTFSSIQNAASDGNSYYHGLQLQLNKRLSYGLSLLGAYTFSRTIDTNSGQQVGISEQNPFDRALERALSNNDRRHVLVVSSVYEMPGIGRSGNFFDRVFGHWEASGIFRYTSGTPLTVTTGQDNSLIGQNQDRPNVAGKPFLDTGRGRNAQMAQYFNTGAFTPNPRGTFGNVGRNTLVGPGAYNIDFALMKNIPVSERWGRFQLRGEFFNLFNHANLGNPNTTLSSPAFGRILTMGAPRVAQVALKYVF